MPFTAEARDMGGREAQTLVRQRDVREARAVAWLRELGLDFSERKASGEQQAVGPRRGFGRGAELVREARVGEHGAERSARISAELAEDDEVSSEPRERDRDLGQSASAAVE